MKPTLLCMRSFFPARHLIPSLLGCSAMLAVLLHPEVLQAAESWTGKPIPGYRGIWFDLGQRSMHGSKYSGGLGTYTAKHGPLAIYAEAVHRTFFVYGGTPEAGQRHLLAMIGAYDHANGEVHQPHVVHDKESVNDPHDNPSLSMDPQGHLWVFVSGRGRHRPGFVYRSRHPYDHTAFERVLEAEFTYPQPWWLGEDGCLHLFTQYTRGRELYWNQSQDGRNWTPPRKLAGMGGHYQISHSVGKRVITAFNAHPDGNVDLRTNLYYLQTHDLGKSWQTITGQEITPPLTDFSHPARVENYQAQGRLVYLKDLVLDEAGQPIILHLISDHHQPGPHRRPRFWRVAHWRDGAWAMEDIAPAWHNYDMGSLYVEKGQAWRLIAPTAPGPQQHGTGGEVILWERQAPGKWQPIKAITHHSERNHAYVRRPLHAHPEFAAFWADGDPDRLSPSLLYFTDREGSGLWQLPETMRTGTAKPLPRH